MLPNISAASGFKMMKVYNAIKKPNRKNKDVNNVNAINNKAFLQTKGRGFKLKPFQ